LEVQRDEGAFTPLNFDDEGAFTLPTALALDGAADGGHVYRFRATDFAGNVSTVEFTLTLDTRAPTLTITAPEANGILSAGSRLTGTVSGTGSAVTALAYSFDGGPALPLSVADTFDVTLDLSRLAPGSHTLRVTAQDAAGNATVQAGSVTL